MLTAEILVRLLANVQTDTRIYNLYDVSMRESGQLMPVLHASVMLLTMNFIITL